MNTNEELIKILLGEAVAPLIKRIEELEAFKNKINALIPKPPKAVVEAQAAIDIIPDDVKKSLNVTQVVFDGNAPWFQLVREDGSRISVKRTGDSEFRVRSRSMTGDLLKETTAKSMNQFVAVIKSLV